MENPNWEIFTRSVAADVSVETSAEGDALLRLSSVSSVRLVGVPPADVNDGLFV